MSLGCARIQRMRAHSSALMRRLPWATEGAPGSSPKRPKAGALVQGLPQANPAGQLAHHAHDLAVGLDICALRANSQAKAR